MATSFGPSALATPANGVTMSRVLATPVLLALIVTSRSTWPAFLLWLVLATTDGLDGYLARRQGTTRSGAFLDPLADKVLVLGAMVALVWDGTFSWLPVAMIAVREIAISMYRSIMARQGVSVPARPSAKVKTIVQDVAVAAALFPPGGPQRWFAMSWLWLAVVLTLVTGAQYLLDGRKVAAGAV